MIEQNYSNNSADFSITVYVSDSKDTDGDGMPDGWEYNNSLDLWNSSDASQDPDSDGMTNLQEYLNHTNPHNWDSDGDGLGDAFEVLFTHTDPNVANSKDPNMSDSVWFLQHYGYLGGVNSLPTGWMGMTISWSNYTIFVQTSSSVLSGSFDNVNQKLGVTVSGVAGTNGSLVIIAPKGLIKSASDLEIWLDNGPLQFTLQQNATHFFAFVNYTHSTHQVSVQFKAGLVKKQGWGFYNYVVVGGGLLIAGIFIAAVFLIEGIFVPVVTGLSLVFLPKKKRRDRELRAYIHGAIDASPGIHYRRIQKLSGSGNGAVTYNLHILEKEGAIYSKTKGNRKCYYPKERRKTKKVSLQNPEISVGESATPTVGD